MDLTHHNGMVNSLQSILESSQYSDMTVHCGHEEFKLHRAMVCPRSAFFATTCNGQYQEGKTGVIDLKEDDPATAKRMFTYLYTQDYDDTGEKASLKFYLPNIEKNAERTILESQLINNVAVYTIAEKYGIPELQDMAKFKFASLMDNQPLTPYLAVIFDAVFETTPSTDTGLRNICISFCKLHDLAIASDLDFSQLLKDHGDLGLGMVRRMVEERAQNDSTVATRIAGLSGQITTSKTQTTANVGRALLLHDEINYSHSSMQGGVLNNYSSRFNEVKDGLARLKEQLNKIRNNMTAA